MQDPVDNEKNDMEKLEKMFSKLLAAGKINKNSLIKKLLASDHTSLHEVTVLENSDILSKSINGPHDEVSEKFLMDDQDITNENLIDDTSRDSNSRIAMEEQRHRHKISNTNSNFYKFRQ